MAYLNAAYLSPQLRSVTAAGQAAVGRKARPWNVTADDFFTEGEQIRRLFAELIGGDPDGVAIMPSVSYGIGIAAANCPVGRGDAIVVLAEQFPSNVYPWRRLAEVTGARIVTVPRPADLDWAASVLDAIDERTAVVAVPICHWTDGSLVDVAAVGEAARAVEAAFVIDATQSLGPVPFDVASVAPDFLVAVGYKWLLGPYSFGYLYASPERRMGVPLEFNWITRSGSEDFARLVDYRNDYQPGARRYDVGERSNFVLAPMAIAALSQILAWGSKAIGDYIEVLTARVERHATRIGLEPVPARRRGPHLIGVRMPAGLAAGLGEELARADVHVSLRSDSIRISPHVYSVPEDVDRLFEVVADLV